MYYYPSHYEPRYEIVDNYDYLASKLPRRTVTRYYIGNPYITSYSDGRFELLRRTPVHSSLRSPSLERELYPTRPFYRASSIPPRESSPVREGLSHSARASSLPPLDTETTNVTIKPKLVSWSPKMADVKTPSSTYTYYSRLPNAPEDKPEPPVRRTYAANPVVFGPRIYTNLSVFPSMRHSSYSLLTPIDRFRYRTVPTKAYSGYPSTSYYSYPTPTKSTSSAYRQSDLYPTRFQINRVTYPSMERFYAGRRTVY